MLTGSQQEFETQFVSTRLRICFGERIRPTCWFRRPAQTDFPINSKPLSIRAFRKFAIARTRLPARGTHALPYCSWRNQRSAMEV
jgi:hypothetical protein